MYHLARCIGTTGAPHSAVLLGDDVLSWRREYRVSERDQGQRWTPVICSDDCVEVGALRILEGALGSERFWSFKALHVILRCALKTLNVGFTPEHGHFFFIQLISIIHFPEGTTRSKMERNTT